MSKQTLAEVFLETAEGLKTGSFGKKPKIGLIALGSEHGVDMLIEAATMAKDSRFDVVVIGTDKQIEGIENVDAKDPSEAHKIMEQMLDSKQIDACVTMHYDFPIGVTTVGRLVSPGRGKEMIFSSTTGTSATDRVEAMVKNAVMGIAVAKSLSKKDPDVGILNVEGARQTEQILKNMQEKGYPIKFANSMRADGGAVMRGNDLLTGSCDIMVADSLTGNLMMKLFSSYTTGGDYEAMGYGYGPGVGEDYQRKIFIVSRASGTPVISSAIRYAYETVEGKLQEKIDAEFKAAKQAGLNEFIEEFKNRKSGANATKTVEVPPKEVVTEGIAGIDIMDLDGVVSKLWETGIYAESGMGCTGPIVMVNDKKVDESLKVLSDAGFITA